MPRVIDLEQSIKQIREKRLSSKRSKITEQYEKDKSFVCRLPYPLSLDTLIDIAERMGIEDEDKVLPELYNVRKKLLQSN